MKYPFASLLAVVLLVGCESSDRYQENVSKTVSATGMKTLEVSSVAGTVRIDAANQNTIAVEAVKKGPSAESLSHVHITVATSGDMVTVASTNDDLTTNVNVDFRITAPASLALHVHNTAGTTRIDGFTSDVISDSQAGTIDVTMAKLGDDQRVSLSNTAGTIALRVPKASDATVSAHSTVGTFDTNFSGLNASREMLVGSGGGGTVGNGSAKVSLTTTTGTIDFTGH